MHTILFVEAACPRPYNAELDRQRARGLGGTEGTVARLAIGLAETHRVIVAQHNRDRAEISGGVEFVPLRQVNREMRPDAVIVLRRAERLWGMRKLFPHARLFLWMHDWEEPPSYWFMHPRNQARHLRMVLALLTTDSTLVCVSAAHLANVENFARRGLIHSEHRLNQVRRTYVYNAVAVPEHLRNSATRWPTNPKKLFFGSVWKGLDLVLTAFEHVRRTLPHVELHVSFYDPPNMKRLPQNVVNLGHLSHDEFCEHVADSFCYFLSGISGPGDVWAGLRRKPCGRHACAGASFWRRSGVAVACRGHRCAQPRCRGEPAFRLVHERPSGSCAPPRISDRRRGPPLERTF